MSPSHEITTLDFIEQTMLERLRDRAKIAFEQFQSGHGPQLSVDESEFPDDVAIISGRASVINRAGSSQSPNSARLSESPQATPAGASGVTTSPITSPVVSDSRVYNVHGNVNMSMGDVMPDFGLEYYNPNHNPSHPQQHPQYINGTNDMNGVGGMGGLGGTGVNGMSGMNMNGMNGGMSHGSGGMLPPPHPGMDQVYGEPHLQQLYTMVRIPFCACQQIDVNRLSATGPRSPVSPTGLRALSGRGLAVTWTWG